MCLPWLDAKQMQIETMHKRSLAKAPLVGVCISEKPQRLRGSSAMLPPIIAIVSSSDGCELGSDREFRLSSLFSPPVYSCFNVLVHIDDRLSRAVPPLSSVRQTCIEKPIDMW